MELLIRSQNRADLVKTEMLGQTNGIIKAYFTNGSCILGEYKSRERALEVLDEIQTAILCSGANYEEIKDMKEKFKSWVATNVKTGVVIYEMPEN